MHIQNAIVWFQSDASMNSILLCALARLTSRERKLLHYSRQMASQFWSPTVNCPSICDRWCCRQIRVYGCDVCLRGKTQTHHTSCRAMLLS